MVCETSHHLGVDVHDCGQARREFCMDGVIKAGMVSADGAENLTACIPRTTDGIERWMRAR